MLRVPHGKVGGVGTASLGPRAISPGLFSISTAPARSHGNTWGDRTVVPHHALVPHACEPEGTRDAQSGPGMGTMMLLLLQSPGLCLWDQAEGGTGFTQRQVMASFSGAWRAARMDNLSTANQTAARSGHSTYPSGLEIITGAEQDG